MMNLIRPANQWTLGLAAVGLVTVPGLSFAEEKPNFVQTVLSPTMLSGYVDTSAHWNPGTGNANLPAYTGNGASPSSKADGFNLNVVALTLSKPAEVTDGWTAGYNATLLLGPDAVGYNPPFTANTANPGSVSLKDTFVQLRAPLGNGLDFKLGTFTELLGYEVFEAGNNPNYTRSYGYMTEPTQLTGALASYQFSPVVSASVGVANTWSPWINSRTFTPPAGVPAKAESFKTYMGSVTLTAPKTLGFLAGSTLLGGITSGYDAFNGVTKTSWYIGGTFNTPIKGVRVGMAHDYVMLGDNGIGGATHASGYQHATAGYILWQATDKLAFNTRADYFMQSRYLVGSGTGFGLPGRAFGLTETVQYDLWKNVLMRLEFRWDHALDSSDPFGGTLVGVPQVDNAYLIAANVIYKF